MDGGVGRLCMDGGAGRRFLVRSAPKWPRIWLLLGSHSRSRSLPPPPPKPPDLRDEGTNTSKGERRTRTPFYIAEHLPPPSSSSSSLLRHHFSPHSSPLHPSPLTPRTSTSTSTSTSNLRHHLILLVRPPPSLLSTPSSLLPSPSRPPSPPSFPHPPHSFVAWRGVRCACGL